MTWIQYWHLIHIHYLHQKLTHPPITIQMDSFIYLFFPFLIVLLLSHVNKIPRLFLFYPHLYKYIYDLQKLAFCVTSSMMYTSKLYKPLLLNYKNRNSLSSLMSNVHLPTIQHTRLTTMTHHVLSIHIHTSMYHTPSILITIHDLHMKYTSLFHNFCMGQTQTYQYPHGSIGGSRVGTTL